MAFKTIQCTTIVTQRNDDQQSKSKTTQYGLAISTMSIIPDVLMNSSYNYEHHLSNTRPVLLKHPNTNSSKTTNHSNNNNDNKTSSSSSPSSSSVLSPLTLSLLSLMEDAINNTTITPPTTASNSSSSSSPSPFPSTTNNNNSKKSDKKNNNNKNDNKALKYNTQYLIPYDLAQVNGCDHASGFDLCAIEIASFSTFQYQIGQKGPCEFIEVSFHSEHAEILFQNKINQTAEMTSVTGRKNHKKNTTNKNPINVSKKYFRIYVPFHKQLNDIKNNINDKEDEDTKKEDVSTTHEIYYVGINIMEHGNGKDF